MRFDEIYLWPRWRSEIASWALRIESPTCARPRTFLTVGTGRCAERGPTIGLEVCLEIRDLPRMLFVRSD